MSTKEQIIRSEKYYAILWMVGVFLILLGLQHTNCAIIGGFLFLTGHIGFILENIKER